MTTARDVKTIAREAFGEFAPCDHESALLQVEQAQHVIAVDYMARTASGGAADEASIALWLIPENREAWVRSIEVAAAMRHRGMGRRLARIAEQIARRCGAERINALPLSGAGGFWRKLGYGPHATMTRVLTKELA